MAQARASSTVDAAPPCTRAACDSLGPISTGGRALTSTRGGRLVREPATNSRESDDWGVFESRPPRSVCAQARKPSSGPLSILHSVQPKAAGLRAGSIESRPPRSVRSRTPEPVSGPPSPPRRDRQAGRLASSLRRARTSHGWLHPRHRLARERLELRWVDRLEARQRDGLPVLQHHQLKIAVLVRHFP